MRKNENFQKCTNAKLKVVFFFIFWVGSFGIGFGQHPDNYFSPEDIQDDLKWLSKKVLAYHPACLNPIRYDSVNNAFHVAFYEAEKQLQELQFLRLLRQTLMSLRCGHTTAIPSKDFYTYYKNAKPKPMYPLQVYATDEDLVVRYNESNDSKISIGDKILTINQESTKDISNSILNFLPSDGYHQSFKKFHLSLNFPTYYLFSRGPNYAFESGILDTAGRFSSHNFSLRSSGKPISKQYGQKSLKFIKSDKYRALAFLSSNPKIGVLKIYGFGGKKGWYKAAFNEIENRKIDHLILDLRGNSGGNLFNANQLLTYLISDTFSLRFERKDQKIKFDGNSDMNFAMRFTMNVFKRLSEKPKGLRPTCEKRGNLLVNRFRFSPAEKYFYKGKLTVLIDGGTFSSASLVASQLRKKRNAVLVGDESGGGAQGCYAMVMPTITLPNTKMRVFLPLYYINHESDALQGRGIIPDFYLLPDLGKKVKGIDTELEYLSKNKQWFK